jgi:hypothetical protein
VVYAILFIILYVNYVTHPDPLTTLYVYDSPSGYALCSLRLVAALFFAHDWLRSIRQEKDRARKWFYVVLCFVAMSWFLSLPVIVLISRFGLEPWYRSFVVAALTQTVTAVLYLLLFLLFLPYRHNRLLWLHTLDVGEQVAFGDTTHLQIFPEVHDGASPRPPPRTSRLPPPPAYIVESTVEFNELPIADPSSAF